MIKINLLKNRGEQTKRSSGTQINYETSIDSVGQEGGGGSGGATKDTVVKIVVLLIWLAGLMAYESYNIGELDSKIAEKNSEKNKLAADIQMKKPIADKARDLQAQLEDLEARIKSIKDLSRIRLREIKAIDFVQNIIPERVWLSSLAINSDKVDFSGGAMSDENLNRFMEALESKSNFKNVILLKAVEQKSKEGTIKVFDITSSLISLD